MDNQGRNLHYNQRSKHLVPTYRVCPQSPVQTQVQSGPWCQECILWHHPWMWRNERTPIRSSLQWKHTQDPIWARSQNWLQASWLLVTSTPSPSILSNSTVYYWKGRSRIPWETMLQPSTVSSSRSSQMLTYSFVIARKGETLWPTQQKLIPFQRHPWTPTHQTCPRWNQIQCQAVPWMHILCSKSLWKHDMQWSQMPLLPQCPSPVQRKRMGCTFFWNSQEKWSDMICLRLSPTKQMDHPLTIPNAIHSQTVQMLWRVYLLYCPRSQHGILDNPSWQTFAMPVHDHLTLGKVLLPPSSNGTCLFTRHIPRENVRTIHRHDLCHSLSRRHTCTYLRFIWWPPTTTWKCFQMAPLQQPSSQCQKIKLLRIGDWIPRLYTYERRYQTATTKGQCNPSRHTAS